MDPLAIDDRGELGHLVQPRRDTSQRLLRLLALLQGRREWNAGIADELEVTERTVRRDVARLRNLGYPIATVHGTGGGYQLEAGTTLPPLMFDAGEAVATLVALRDWAASGQPDTSDGALSALDKLGRVMPPRLRPALLLLLNARLTVIRPAELRAAFSELATSIAHIVSDTEATQSRTATGPADSVDGHHECLT
jgi:predicted DNA-binding transcriptional regulator YafY